MILESQWEKEKGWKCGMLVKKGQIPVPHYNNCTWRAQGSDLMSGEVKKRLKVLCFFP